MSLNRFSWIIKSQLTHSKPWKTEDKDTGDQEWQSLKCAFRLVKPLQHNLPLHQRSKCCLHSKHCLTLQNNALMLPIAPKRSNGRLFQATLNPAFDSPKSRFIQCEYYFEVGLSDLVLTCSKVVKGDRIVAKASTISPLFLQVCQFVVSVNGLNVLSQDYRTVSNLILTGPRTIVMEVMEEV